jgi:flagellar biosynthetic protein FliQ
MTGAETLDVARDAIWTIVVVSAPLMVVGLVVGVVVSLVQALTQIQEQSLVFVPKIMAIHRWLMHSPGPCALTSPYCRPSPPPSCWYSPASARW